MSVSDYRIVDLVHQFDQNLFRKWIDFLQNSVLHDAHPNRELYLNLHNEFRDYYCFLIVIDSAKDDEIVGFEGMWNPRAFRCNTARILNRKYIAHSYRATGLIGRGYIEDSLTTQLTLPYQLKLAEEKKLDSVFFSFAEDHRFGSYRRLIEILNSQLPEKWKFQILSSKFNTCREFDERGYRVGVNPSASCWQNIAWCPLNSEAIFNLPQGDPVI